MSAKSYEFLQQNMTGDIPNCDPLLKRNSLVKDEVIKPSLRDIAPQILVCFIVHGITIQAGINMAYSTILINGLKSDNDIVSNINEHQISWIASLVTISAPIGSMLSGPLMDKFGRRLICFISCIPCIISWILLIQAHSVDMIYASRIISGIGAGLTSVALVYTAETSHPHVRPMLLTFNSIYVAFGILAVCCLGSFLTWYGMAIVFLVMNCITFCSLFFIPESPLWLLSFGNEKSMEKRMRIVENNLKRLNPRESIYIQECERIRAICIEGQSKKSDKESLAKSVYKYLEQLTYPKAYKPIIILTMILILQQLSGAYVVIFYAISVFQEMGGTFGGGLDEFGALILMGVIRFSMSIVNAHLSKIYGRRPLIITSGIGMSVSMFFSAIYLFLTSSYNNSFTVMLSSQKWLLLVIILFYVCASSLGFLVIPWTLIGELLPTSIRGIFCGLIISLAYLVMFGVIKGYPYALKAMGAQSIFFLFSVTSILATLYIYFYLPETKGKSLSDIERYFEGKRKENCSSA